MNKKNNKMICWMGFAFLLLLEFCIFYNYINREIIPFYPKAYDQTSYLQTSYQLYEDMLNRGRVLKYLIALPLLPQTLLFHLQAALFFLIFGASRLSALMINFIYLALVQLLTFFVLHSLTHRYRYGFIFCGILLTVNSLILASDFRIDFIAACLYGMLSAVILLSNIFLSRRLMWLALAISAWLILMRYVTVCYVVGLTGALFFYYGCLWLRYWDNITKTRLCNLFLFTIGILLIITPVLWINREVLYNYYVVGHVTGAEKAMRLASALNIVHTTYLFYPTVFFASHFSLTILKQLSVILLSYSAILLYFWRWSKNKTTKFSFFAGKDIFIFLLFAILIPTIVLSLDTSKSFLVINIITIPFVYLLIFIYAYFSEMLFSYTPTLANRFLTIVTIFFLGVGLYNFNMHFSKERNHSARNEKDFIVTKMTDDMGDYASFLGWHEINMASDFLADYINAPLSPFYYERQHTLFNVMTLPLGNNGMSAIDENTAFTSLVAADFYTTNLNHYTPDPIFPFEQSIAPYRKSLQETANKNMIFIGEYYIFDAMLRVYARPDIRIEGIVDEWITNEGIWLYIPTQVANQVKTVQLEGKSDFSWLKNKSLTARAITSNTPHSQSLPIKLLIKNNVYQITCRLPAIPSTHPLVIHITFSDYFNHPSKNEFKKLVMKAPTKKIFFK